MNSNEIRTRFLKFFENRGHAIIPSASLVPENDPSTLFNTAGMQPLVPYLLGQAHPKGSRLVDCQKCVRTGDIDDVGDNRHLTFFEMLGNWSLGDYFKQEAINWSLEFLTNKEEGLGLDINRLYVTVFKGENGIPRDEEAISVWKEAFAKLGITAEVAGEDEQVGGNIRIVPLGVDDNFWIAGATGPCGGDTEMFYDTRPEEGALSGKFGDLVDSFRLIEVWNDVFMEFNRIRTDKTILVDGMHCLYNDKFEIDEELLKTISNFNARKILVVNGYKKEAEGLLNTHGYEVFCLQEDGFKKDQPEFFLKLLAKYSLEPEEVVYFDHLDTNVNSAKSVGITSELYTKVLRTKEFIEQNLFTYEQLAKKNVDTGMGLERTTAVVNGHATVFDTDLFEDLLAQISDLAKKDDGKARRIVADHIRTAVFMIADGVIPSNTDRGYVLRRILRRAIRFSDVLGMPANSLASLSDVVIAKYANVYDNLAPQTENINQEITKEEEKFGKTLKKGLAVLNREIKAQILKRGEPYKLDESNHIRLLNGPDSIQIWDTLPVEISGKWLFDFYQTLGFPPEMVIEELKSRFGNYYFSSQKQREILDEFNAEMKKHQELSKSGSEERFKGGLGGASDKIVKYHTATHLLQQALVDVLGPEVSQKGSNITEERLRFDFAWPTKMTDEQKAEVEKIVNEKITANLSVNKVILSKDEAEKTGARHLFSEKYGDEVSIYFIGDSLDTAYSKEFCGGPHVENTGVLGHFKITKEEAVAAGVRRIKATLG